jgi:F0F1-type ATP synthase assembly protein I
LKLYPANRTAQLAGNRQSGDALAKGAEHAGVILFFFGLGWLVDRWLGTKPIFMIVLMVLGIVGQFARLWYAYDADMKSHEQRLASHRDPVS